MKPLINLNIGNYGGRCRYISHNYLDPISQVSELHLSESGFLEGPQTLLKPLINLKILHINDVSSYKECPNLAKELFANLPQGLENLRARDWKTHFAMNASCIIDQQTLEGLKILPNLTTLDFRYSDKIFGNTIPKSLFHGMEALKSLDLGWSRFNDIETGAFSGLNLTSLVLDSNQLGTREFWPFGPDSPTLTSPVKTLSMFKCGIDALDYYAYFITRSFPNLESLDLGYNDWFTCRNSERKVILRQPQK